MTIVNLSTVSCKTADDDSLYVSLIHHMHRFESGHSLAYIGNFDQLKPTSSSLQLYLSIRICQKINFELSAQAIVEVIQLINSIVQIMKLSIFLSDGFLGDHTQ